MPISRPFFLFLLSLVLFVGSFLFVSSNAVAEQRIALVLGNGAYSFSPLKNPPNDAQLVSDALRKTGFEVIEQKNACRKQTKQAVRDFSNWLKGTHDAIALFFYAGHGVQLEDRNYLVPVDAKVQSQADVAFADSKFKSESEEEKNAFFSVIFKIRSLKIEHGIDMNPGIKTHLDFFTK